MISNDDKDQKETDPKDKGKDKDKKEEKKEKKSNADSGKIVNLMAGELGFVDVVRIPCEQVQEEKTNC